jgi:hypothetical protein
VVSNLALFCLTTVFGYFKKNWVIFSKSSGHPAEMSPAQRRDDAGVQTHRIVDVPTRRGVVDDVLRRTRRFGVQRRGVAFVVVLDVHRDVPGLERRRFAGVGRHLGVVVSPALHEAFGGEGRKVPDLKSQFC